MRKGEKKTLTAGISSNMYLRFVEYYPALASLAEGIEGELRQGWLKVSQRRARTVKFFDKTIGAVELASKLGLIKFEPVDFRSGAAVVHGASKPEPAIFQIRKAENYITALMGGEEYLPEEFADVRQFMREKEAE